MSKKEKPERRSGPRSATDQKVTFSIDGVVFKGRVLNLSPDGCMIDGDCVMATARRHISVALVSGYSVPGTVAWKNGNRIGVVFHEPLLEATLRYFQLHSLKHEEHEPFADRFGRDIPPMRSKNDLG